MPSAVLYTKGRMLTVGHAALQAALTDPQGFEASPKRHIDEPEILLAGMFVPVTDLVAAVLADAIAKAQEVTGEPPGEVVLTYPDQWRPAIRQKLVTAAEVAGIDQQRLRLVSESVAAASYFTETNDDLPVGARLVVFDFGAGTCDVAALDKQADGSFTVVAADGFDKLGGLELDARVQTWALAQLAAVNPALAAELGNVANAAGRLALTSAIRGAKEALSGADAVPIELCGMVGSEVLQLTRAQFEQLISADVERAVKLTKSVLFQANTVRSVQDPVVFHMTGGSSRIPLVQARLAALGRIGAVDDSKTVITQGALHTSATLWQPASTWSPAKVEGAAATPGQPATSGRRKRITPLMKKWAAGIALVAIVASGVGVAAAMIFGSMTAPKPSQQGATPRTTLAPPSPKVPTPVEFTVGVIVTEQTCVPEGPCTYKYTIEPKYIGLHPLPETPFTVFYEVVDGNAPQPGEFTVQKDQAKILKDVVLEGPPNARLTANVMNVTG